MPAKGGNRSAIIVAKLLGTEGYSDFVHNQIERYWRQVVFKGRRRRLDKFDKEFSAIMQKLSDGDKMIVGKFISLRSKMSFDTGLRIGLTALAHVGDKPIFDDERLAEPLAAKDGTSDPVKAVAGALKNEIITHGPIGMNQIQSAAKRAVGVLEQNGSKSA